MRGMVLALGKGVTNTSEWGDNMNTPNKPATIYQWSEDPTKACSGQTRGRMAEAVVSEPIPGRSGVPAGRAAERVRKSDNRLILYEKRGSLGVITAKVQNVGDVYDEIDALLDEIERDGDIRTIAIYTLNGLFASLPIR